MKKTKWITPLLTVASVGSLPLFVAGCNCSGNQSITPDVENVYDDLKELDVNTSEKEAVNYFFKSNDVKSLINLKVSVTNLKIDGQEKTIEAGLVNIFKTNSDGYIRIDFNITTLFTKYSITDDCTVTFDLNFKNDTTGLNKTISGYKLNVSSVAPVIEETTFSIQNGALTETDGQQWACGCGSPYGNDWVVYLAGIFRVSPKLIEKLNVTKFKFENVSDGGRYKDVLLTFPEDGDVDYTQSSCACIKMPSCVKELEIGDAGAGNSGKVITLCCPGTNYSKSPDGPKFGFEKIDLGSNITHSDYVNDVKLYGNFVNADFGSLSNHENLKTLVFTKNRKITLTVENYNSGYQSNNKSPIRGCPNLSTIDVSNYTAAEDLNNLIFTISGTSGENKIFDFDQKTHAETGTVIIANASLETAWKEKFAAAGLYIDGTNWKFQVKQ